MPSGSLRMSIPQSLLEAAKEKNVILFIGAGFSKNVDEKLPVGDQFIDLLAAYTEFDPKLLDLHCVSDYSILAEHLIATNKYNDAIQALENKFLNQLPKVKESKPHYNLVEFETDYIFTTNWDNFIEKAFEIRQKPLRVARDYIDLLPKRNKVSSSHKLPLLIKYHGDFSKRDKLVFSLESFLDRIADETPFDILLKSQLLTKQLLFIGYSFSDPNLRLIWHKIRNMKLRVSSGQHSAETNNSYLLLTKPNPVAAEWLSKIGVEVILADPDPRRASESVEFLIKAISGAQR